jgi:hypothetical protein
MHRLVPVAACVIVLVSVLAGCSNGTGQSMDASAFRHDANLLCNRASSSNTSTSIAYSSGQQFQDAVLSFSQLHASDESIYEGLAHLTSRFPSAVYVPRVRELLATWKPYLISEQTLISQMKSITDRQITPTSRPSFESLASAFGQLAAETANKVSLPLHSLFSAC